MRALQLTRTPEDRRLYDLRGVGTLRVGRWPSRKVAARTGTASYTFDKRGGGKRFVATATDPSTGEEVASVSMHVLRREGAARFRWRTVEWELRHSDIWPTAFALSRPGDEHEAVIVETQAWAGRPVRVAVDDATATDAGLLLFTVFAVRVVTDAMIASAAGSASGGGSG